MRDYEPGDGKMRKASLIVILLVLLFSIFLLSVLSNLLTGYREAQRPHENEKRQSISDTEKEPSVLLFTVSPVTPQLFWRVSTLDYYTGFDWLRTTEEKILEAFPQVQDDNATKVFTVEISASQRETFLPLPSPNPNLANLSLAPIEGLEFYRDTAGDVYKVMKHVQAKVPFVYNVSWRDVEVDDRLISLSNIPEDILDRYLQLPDMPIEVFKLAKDLEDPSYSVLDQVLADTQYLRVNFVYDEEDSRSLREGATLGSNVLSYIEQRKGVCVDAATALAVLLRMQKIPARISIGYKPERIEDGKLLYYKSSAHAVTEAYLPPYGWIQFDATPPLQKDPLVRMLPFKKESSRGSRLFYQLSITNRRNSTDNFKLFVDSRQKWNISGAPRELEVSALQTVDALLEVNIPEDADVGGKDLVTVTVASRSHPESAFSIFAIAQVADILHIPTITTLGNMDKAVTRGDTFWVNGTVLAAGGEQVENMTIFIFLTRNRADGLIVGKGYSKQGNFQIENSVPYSFEIGDYNVITISLGTTQYSPSGSDSTIRVRATTIMELDSEERFLLRYGAIHGNLFWDNGTGFAEASVSLKITSLTSPSEVLELQKSTLKDGSFRTETVFENPGEYEVKGTFSGNEYVSGSNTTHVIELKRGVPTIRIFGENTAIRGEVFNMTCAIHFEDIPVWGEPVTLAFDNQVLTTIETRDNGSFTWSFPIDSEEKLGPHFLTVSLDKGNLSKVQNVMVKSKTKMTTKVSHVSGGMFLLFSIALSDDHDLPIQRAGIVVDNYGLSWKTDTNGNLTFLLDTVRLWPESLALTARFEGSELYFPVTIEKEFVLEPFIGLPFLIPLVAPTLATLGFAYAKHQMETRTRTQSVRHTSDMEEKEETTAEEIIYEHQARQPLKIFLPDVETRFPNVWGVNDKLRLRILLDENVLEKTQEREADVFIDERNVASLRLSEQGGAELSYVFTEKGEHSVRAILPRTSGHRPWIAEVKIRIVDYREEIITLYNEFLESLASHDIHARNEMTAREIESLILKTGDFSPEALSRVTTCFEKTEYSSNRTTRNDYETMYLSVKDVNVDAE